MENGLYTYFLPLLEFIPMKTVCSNDEKLVINLYRGIVRFCYLFLIHFNSTLSKRWSSELESDVAASVMLYCPNVVSTSAFEHGTIFSGL